MFSNRLNSDSYTGHYISIEIDDTQYGKNRSIKEIIVCFSGDKLISGFIIKLAGKIVFTLNQNSPISRPKAKDRRISRYGARYKPHARSGGSLPNERPAI